MDVRREGAREVAKIIARTRPHVCTDRGRVEIEVVQILAKETKPPDDRVDLLPGDGG